MTNPRSFRLKVTAGPHVIGAAVVDQQRAAGVDDQFSDFRINSAFTPGGGVQTVAITGPFNATGPGDTPSRRRIFVCRPATASEEAPCARKIVTTLGRRAYRRALRRRRSRDADGVLSAGPQRAGTSRSGIQQALARMLVAPQFLFRVEEEPASVRAGRRLSHQRSRAGLAAVVLPLEQHPDDELLDVAAKGRLRDPAVLEQQVKRMLADPEVGSADHELRRPVAVPARARERADRRRRTSTTTCARRSGARPRCSSATIVREDRSIIDLLDADYTFVDERLARHYGIPNVHGSYFRRVPLDADESAPRPARPGQHADGDVGRRRARRRCRAASGFSRTCSARRRRCRRPASRPTSRRIRTQVKVDVAAAAAGSAPREPGVRVVPQDHGPDRVRAGELRPGRRRGANATAARRSTRPASSSTARRCNGPADLRQALLTGPTRS